jgi:hypothetical protein
MITVRPTIVMGSTVHFPLTQTAHEGLVNLLYECRQLQATTILNPHDTATVSLEETVLAPRAVVAGIIP